MRVFGYATSPVRETSGPSTIFSQADVRVAASITAPSAIATVLNFFNAAGKANQTPCLRNERQISRALLRLVCLLLVLLGPAHPSRAQGNGGIISLNFAGNAASPMAATETAGVVAVPNWNNGTGASGSLSSLADNTGTASGASVSWSAPNPWAMPITETPGNARMMKGYLDTPTTSTVTVSGLPTRFTSGGYDVYVYCDGDNGAHAHQATYAIGSTSVSLTDASNVNFSGTFTQGSGSAGNYVKLANQTAASFTLTATAGTSTGVPRAPVNGIEIISHAAYSGSWNQARFFPRAGFAARMTGGKFQGSQDGSTYTDLYTIASQPTSGQWTVVPLSADPKTFRYLRYLGPDGGWCNVAEVEFYSGGSKVTGTPYGTAGSYNNQGNVFSKALDGNTASFYDAAAASAAYTGIMVDGLAPAAPTNLAVTPGNGQVSLTWSASAGAMSYNLYRGTSAGGENATPVATGLTGTSYTDAGLTNGTTYYYKLTAINTGGESAPSNEASAAPIAPPAAPINLTATPGNNQAILVWTASAGATSYNLYRGMSAGGENATPVATGLTGTSYTDTGLTGGTTYYYKLTAVNAGGESAQSNEAVSAVSPTPTILTSIAVTPATVSVVVGAAQQFTAVAKDQNGNPISPQPVITWSVNAGGTINANGLFTAGGLADGPFTITATSGSIAGQASVTIIPAPLAVPTSLTAKAISTTEIDLAWVFSDGAEGYEIERSADGATGWTQIATATSVPYQDTGLSGGTTYYYRVKATQTGSPDSTPSATAHALTFPAAPTGLAATAGASQVSLTWNATTGAASYNLYRGVSPGAEGDTPYKTGLTGTSYADTAQTSITTYYYWLTAVNASGESAPSNQASATPVNTSATSQSSIIQIAAAFCQAVGAPVDITTAVTQFPAPSRYSGQQDSYWLPRWLVTFGNSAEVEVVDSTHVVNRYYNYALSQQLMDANQPAGTSQSEADAVQQATLDLQATGQTEPLGSPTDQNFQLTSPATSAGNLWYVSWARQFGGIPYMRQQATVMLQAETGALQALSLTFPSPPAASATATVTSDQANATALAQLQSTGVQGLIAQSASEQFVQPNTFWQQGGSASPAPGASVQLAWVCTFTDSTNLTWEVWIDANTGAVIGGETWGTLAARNKPAAKATRRPSAHRQTHIKPAKKQLTHFGVKGN